MPAELIRRGLLDYRRALLGWSLGVIGYAALTVSIFPSIKGSGAFKNLAQNYPDALKSIFGLNGGNITTGAGYVDVELFSLMLPLLILVLAIGAGARALAGEEESGRLELVLSYPVRRRDAVLAKGAAVAGEVVLVCAVGFAALAVLNYAVGLELSLGRLAAAFGALAVLGVLYGWLALAVGAAYPSRTLAIGLATAFAAAGYLVNGLHALAGWLNPLRVISPFWLIGPAPMQNGVDGAGVLVVAAVAVAVLVAGSLLIERRDLEAP